MRQYHNLELEVLKSEDSVYKPNRTGIDTISLFGAQIRFRLSEGFPLMTTKKLHLKSIVYELKWFLEGNTNVKFLNENGVRIWNEWADADGNLGPIYGKQWRAWPDYDGGSIDQLQKIVNMLKKNPDSRRAIVSAWNVAQLEKMALQPCHVLYQMEVNNRNGADELDLSLYQRSGDIFLGIPFNIAEYALLTHIIANELGLKPGTLVHTIGDLHMYCGAGKTGLFYKDNLGRIKDMIRKVDNRKGYLLVRDEILGMMKASGVEHDLADHVPQCLEQLAREPRPLPKLILDSRAGINNLLFEYVKIDGYDPHPSIKGEVAV
ncbi:MAG: thymidylate synthase [Candidatus Woesearchaeota archaeon]